MGVNFGNEDQKEEDFRHGDEDASWDPQCIRVESCPKLETEIESPKNHCGPALDHMDWKRTSRQ